MLVTRLSLTLLLTCPALMMAQVATTTSLTSAPNPSIFGQSVTLTATVSDITATGTVEFFDGATDLGPGTVSSGVATLSLTTLSTGVHPTMTGVYSGDINFQPSTSLNHSQTVNARTTTTALTSSGSPITYGHSVTLTAAVSPSTASGRVAFYDGTTMLGSGTLASGHTVFTTGQLASGIRSLQARYVGDSNDSLSTSPALAETVNAVAGNGFESTTLYSTGNAPSGIATADLNGDGIPDLAVTNQSDGTVSVLFGNSNGTFGTANSYSFGGSPVSVATADFNGDGFPDLVVADNAHSNLEVFLNDGTGAFNTGPVTYSLSGGASWVTVGDFNNDGFADIAATNPAAGTVSVLLGNASGGFTSAAGSPYFVGSSPSSVAVGYLNSDAFPDLVVSNGGSNNISVLLGVGDGTFPSGIAPTYSVGFHPSSVTVGYLNGSPLPYVAVTNLFDGDVSVLTGNASGVFSAAAGSPFASGFNPNAVVLGDFNGDGTPDLAVAGLSGIGIHLGNGDGTFQAVSQIPATYLVNLVVGDFNGDGIADIASVDTSSGNVDVSLGLLATTTTLISSSNPSTYGSSVTLTATLSPLSATGTVTFFDGSTALGLGPVTLVSGVAALPIATLAGGPHSITAVYSGNSIDAVSTSAVLTQTVNTAATTTLLTSAPNPSTLGAFVTLTATVSPSAATGTVSFYDGGSTNIGSATITSGVATLTTAALNLGPHSLTAVYGGNADFASSISTASIQTVNADATTTTLTSSANPSVAGQTVVLTATVSPSSATGSVTFFDGSTSLGTGSLSSGVAALSSASLAAGNHSLTAVYGGDSTDATSTSSVLTQTVRSATVLTLTSSATPIVYGHTVTLTAGATPSSATGKVTFYDGTTVLGTSTLASGHATFTTKLLAAGARSLKAHYVGDLNDTSATSSAIVETVNAVAGNGFESATLFATGSAPSGIATADLNGDGIPDLAVTNELAGTVSVLFGNSNGTFGTAVSYSAGAAPVSLATADFNGDGFPDLVAADNTHSNLEVFLNDGTGAFTGPVIYSLSGGANWVTVGDFNNDGFADIAATNQFAGTVSVLLGNASGGFTAAAGSPYGVGSSPSSVAVGYLNSDAFPDLVVSNSGSNNISVLLGVGDGTFPSGIAPTYSVGFHPSSVTVGYLNGSPLPYVAVTNLFDGDVSVLTGNASGVFSAVAGSPFASGFNPNAATLGDFNGDGTPDLAVASLGAIRVLLGNGDGTFQTPSLVGTDSTADLVVGDFNGDGIADIASVDTSSGNVDVSLGLLATTTTLISSSNPSTYGSSVTLTATLSPLSATGTVTFFDGSTALGLGPVTLVSGVAALPIATLAGGPHSITAVYSGNSIDAVSTSAVLTQTVNTAATTTLLTSAPNPSTLGAFVTLTATVSPSAATGTVSFYDGGSTNIGSATITSGVATLTTAALNLGPHSLTAVYGGNADFASSISTASIQTVNADATTTTLTSSANPSVAGQTVVLTATVSPSSATGSVTFFDGSTSLGTGSLSSGVAALSSASLAAGNHSLTAVYGGDSTDATSTSSVLTQTVRSATVLTLTSSATPIVYGHTVTLTAGATPSSATGKVTFYDGTTVLGTSTLASGHATFTTKLLAAGARSLKAHYVGDLNDTSATSSAIVETVNAVAGNGFESATLFATGSAPSGIATADLNGDGIPDLAVTNESDGTVSVLFGNSNGTFGTINSYSFGGSPVSVATADFNGDGFPDLVVADNAHSNLEVFLNDGTGAFNTGPVTYSLSGGASWVTVGDFNNDGFADIAATNPAAGTVSVLLGNASGGFTAAAGSPYGVGSSPSSVAVGYLNSDAFPDLVVSNSGSNNISVLLGVGDGTFPSGIAPTYSVGFHPSSVTVGYLNGSPLPYVAVTNLFDGDVSVLTGNASGVFSAVAGSPFASGFNPNAATLGDFNGDGTPDLAVASLGAIRVLLGNGDGTFQTPSLVGTDSTADLVVGDFNGDGIADIASVDTSSGNVDVSLGLLATTTTLISSSNPSTYGSSVTLTATLSPLSATGTVTFFDGSTALGLGPVTLVSGVAALPIATLAGGPHSITAVYSGNSIDAVSTSAVLTQTVNTAATTTLLTSAPNPSTLGAFVTLTATVSPSAATGTVSFYDGGSTNIGSATITSGVATLTTAALNLGPHSLTAVYGGNADFASSISTASIQTVNADATTTTLTSSANPSVAGQTVVLTATVSPSSATGSVTFFDGSTSLGTGSLSSGVAALSSASLAAGNHSLTAVYGGDSTDATSTSSVLTQTVRSATVLTLTSSATPIVYGHTVTLTAGATPSSATGKVTFYDGTTVLGTSTLASGQAAFTTAQLASGTRSLTAFYVGDLHDSTGTSNVLAETVTAGVGGGFAAPSVYGTDLTSQALATADFNGDGIPDIAVADADGTVNVFFGSSNGTFGTPGVYTVAGSAAAIVAGDFNGDGFIDLAVADRASNSVAIFLNNGAGAFPTRSTIGVGNAASSLVSGDFNRDGSIDLAVANQSDNTVTILLGNGVGGFTAAAGSPYAVGFSPVAEAVGDFNNDGIADIVTVNRIDNTISLLIGNGTGGFTAAGGSPYSVGILPCSVVVGYTSGTGLPYIAVANQLASTVSILLGNGAGHFSPASGSPVSIGSSPFKLTLGDFNGDGVTDLAVATLGSVFVLSGNGDATFQNPRTTGSGGASDIIVGDFNGDGITDIATTPLGTSTLNVLLALAPSTTTLTSSLNPSSFGSNVTFTATLAPSSASGTVTFMDGSTALGTGPVAIISGVATLVLSALSGGPHSITAIYSGDINYASGTSAPLTQVVNPDVTTTTLTSSINPSTVGGAVLFTATVSPSGAPGTVAFFHGSTSLGVVGLTSGVAALPFASLPQGVNTLTAVYGGTSSYATSTSAPLTQTVLGASSITLTSSLNPSTFGNSVTFTATVAPSSATGTVTFLDSSTILGSGAVTLMNGVATLVLPTLTVGPHAITAIYSGDVNNSGALSSVVSQLVDAATAITLTSSVSPATYGSAVVVTATLLPNTATGKVTFYSGSTPLATGPVVSGEAVLTTYLLPTGTGKLSARYLGDPGDAAAVSASLPQTVHSAPAGGFQTNLNFSAGGAPTFVAGGDFNGDGIADFAVADSISGQVTVFLGAGAGAFQPPASYGVGATPTSIAIGDFNGDGIADIAAANSSSNNVSVLLGNSNGTFQPAVNFAAGIAPQFVAVGDFNGDGNADLVVAGSISGNVGILLGNGDGTFAANVTYAAGIQPYSIAVGDFNGDGVADLAVANRSAHTLSVLLGNGDGTFPGPVTYSVGTSPQSVATADFNGDGFIDLVVANTNDNNVSVLLGNGNGTFQPASNFIVGGRPRSVATGDIDGDGKADIVVTNANDNEVGVLLGNGDGTFLPQAVYGVAQVPVSVAVGDFAADGRSSLITANQGGDNVSILLPIAPLFTTTTTLTSSANPSAFGQSVTVTATLLPATASGTVTFFDGSTNLGTRTLSSGVATLPVVSLSVGSHSLTAVYGGDVSDLSSTSPVLTQIVGQAATITTLTSSANPTSYGQSVTLSAAILPSSATGTVTFMSGSTSLGSSSITAGVATLLIASLPPGASSLTAVYNGDSNDAIGTSSPLIETVNRATSTTTVTSSANPSHFGQNITLTAVVSPSSATGLVTFQDGAAVLGTSGVTGGVATLVAAQLAVGTHSLTASYGGSVDDAGSTSAVLSQAVTQAPNTTVLTSSANPSTYQQSIVLTASVSPSTATGSITFKDGASVLGSVPLTGGLAAIPLSTLSVGLHALSAVYGGDTNDAPSTSQTLNQTVNPLTTTTTLTSLVNPSPYGQSVLLTAAVIPSSATGSITLKDGGVVILTAPLINGVATLAPQNLSSGTHALTAIYSGDASDSGSTGALNLQIDGCGTMTTSSLFVDSMGGPQLIAVTSTGPTCVWNATTSSSWIQLSQSGGTGTGVLTATLLENTSGVVRSGTIEVGGQTIAVTQRITATAFGDVPPSVYYFDAVNQLYAKQITSGCSTEPANYCPNLDIERWEMAVFIVRSIYGGDNFTASTTPYFNDVAPGDPGFAWIQKMYELGITSGCGNSDFCPGTNVPRDQMAVFVIRLRYGATSMFDFPSTPYFTDVTADSFGWSWIQRMREDTITGGCTSTLFCPSGLVTRGEMALFMMLGGFNQGVPPDLPVISSISPATIAHGASATYTITGVNTNFVSGVTALAAMPGITIGTVTVSNATSLTVQLTAAADAVLQPVSVLAITGNPPGNEEAVLPNGLVIQ